MLNVQGQLRLLLLKMYYQVNAGHIGCSLSCIDILISILLNTKNGEDVLLLSKGHAAAALYATLQFKGEISEMEISSFYKNGTSLPAHPAPNKFKSIPFATGSLGHGFPIGTGIAKGKKLKGKNKEFVYVLMSDGETNEGTTWEAAHFAVANELNNLIVIIDRNGIQGFDFTENVLGDTADFRKWYEIGFEVVEIDGHSVHLLMESIEIFKKSPNYKPKLIIANTIKGKGVSFMENTVDWHYLPMKEDQYRIACEEINLKYGA